MCGVNIKTPISMARALPIMGTAIFLLLTLFSIHAKGDFATTLDPKLHGFNKAENLTHLHFYLHDIYSGTNPTASAIVRPPSGASPAGFGAVSMIDDPLTEGPDIGSQLVGKAQGFYGQASQQDAGLLMAMNLVLLDEKYNGSYITVLGRNKVFDKVREMPVVGGSGLFRFARGYAQASTYTFNQNSGDAIVEYNVYVMH